MDNVTTARLEEGLAADTRESIEALVAKRDARPTAVAAAHQRKTRAMTRTAGADLGHTSFAVADALAWARRLRQELGAVPIAGEALPEFRYLLLYVGTADAGARIELLEPTGDGFLARFLAVHGEGPHHLTFAVPDLAAAVRHVRLLGLRVTGENYGHAPWREAFIVPDTIHGTVIQLAQSDLVYPAPDELLATRERRQLPEQPGRARPVVVELRVGHRADGAWPAGRDAPRFDRAEHLATAVRERARRATGRGGRHVAVHVAQRIRPRASRRPPWHRCNGT